MVWHKATGLIAATSVAIAGPVSAAPADSIAAVNRLTWGVTSGALAAGADPRALFAPARPDSALPAAAAAQIAGMRITTEPMAQLVSEMQEQQRATNTITDPTQKATAQQAYQAAMSDLSREAATRSILRDLYSPTQLREQMTWFWFNHFNVDAQKAEIRAMVGDYEDQAIRPRALGKFRDLLEATLQHPAMLRYLDNAQNAAGHINENYAREIMELHTLGVNSGAYTQADVQELARILTGVGINLKPDPPRLKPELQALYIRHGLFEFNPARHDFGTKHFLGHTIGGPGNPAGYAEVSQALDLIARSPATASHVSGQIAAYFMGDANGKGPPPALVARMAQTFLRSDGDIAAVLKVMMASPEYRASQGKAFKDPVHYVISAVRYAYDDASDGRAILNADPIIGWLNRLGEPLYRHQTPDGYPTGIANWTGPGQMEVRFEIARAIGNGSAGLFRPRGANTTDRPAFPQLQNALYYNGLATTLTAPTRAALAQATSPQEWNMLFLASPDFMRR